MFIFHSFTSAVSGPFVPTRAELGMSDDVIGYWARFAATGNPNGSGAPSPWFEYGKNADNNGRANDFFSSNAQGDDKKDVFLIIDTPISPASGFHSDQCDFWDELIGDTNNGHGRGR
jgi:hypothetical protein